MRMNARRVTVLLSEEEYTQVRRNANLVPLSRYFKSLALGVKQANVAANPIPDVQSKPAIRADAGREFMPTRPTAARLAATISGVTTGNKLIRCMCGDLQSEHREGKGRCFGKNCACSVFELQ